MFTLDSAPRLMPWAASTLPYLVSHSHTPAKAARSLNLSCYVRIMLVGAQVGRNQTPRVHVPVALSQYQNLRKGLLAVLHSSRPQLQSLALISEPGIVLRKIVPITWG